MKNCSIGFINKLSNQSIEESLPDVIPFVFDQIEKMEIVAQNRIESDSYKDFIARHRTLKVLKISNSVSGEYLMQLMSIITKSMPNLIEVKIGCKMLTIKWLYVLWKHKLI